MKRIKLNGQIVVTADIRADRLIKEGKAELAPVAGEAPAPELGETAKPYKNRMMSASDKAH